jgi:hypothetical protein
MDYKNNSQNYSSYTKNQFQCKNKRLKNCYFIKIGYSTSSGNYLAETSIYCRYLSIKFLVAQELLLVEKERYDSNPKWEFAKLCGLVKMKRLEANEKHNMLIISIICDTRSLNRKTRK